MTVLHGRWRRRVSLLVSGALDGPEREATLGHLDRCARCRTERPALESVLALVAQDPLRGAEPQAPVSALVTRVQASLDAPARRSPPRSAGARQWWPMAAAAAVLAALMWLPERLPRAKVATPEESAAEQVAMPDEMIDRLERSMARQQAVRYLSQAQAVLVNVSSPPDCHREVARVDVEQEARQSRELLARRALLVELDGDPVMSARPVLEDVDTMLREVASLPACALPRDLEAIHREITRRRLLMKIDLMTRELSG